MTGRDTDMWSSTSQEIMKAVQQLSGEERAVVVKAMWRLLRVNVG
jgi:hypothetical protein